MNLFVSAPRARPGRLRGARSGTRARAITAFGRSAPEHRGRARRPRRSSSGARGGRSDLARAMPGHDAKLPSSAPEGSRSPPMFADGARNRRRDAARGVRRLVGDVLRTGGADRQMVLRLLPGPASVTRQAVEPGRGRAITNGALDSDGAAFRTPRRRRPHGPIRPWAGRPASSAVLSRSDVADVMIDAVERATFIRDIVSVRGARA